MSYEETVEQELRLLGAAVAPGPSFVGDVMSRVSQTHVAPPGTTVFRRTMKSLLQPRISIAAACVIALALFATLPFGRHSERTAGGWWLGPASVYAQELVTVLDKARPGGVTAREQTTFIMSDGSRTVSSTVSILFLSQDRYRRDIYDDNQLRETQWYVPDADGLTQTSIRLKAGDYQIDKHQEPSKVVDHVAKLRAVVKAVDKADRRLGPEEIEGQKCIGFEISAAKLDGPKGEKICRIWFNAETKLPVRIETDNSKLEKTPAFAHGIRGMINTLDHFDWSPRLPANTFTPYIPEGFRKVQK